ncbi:Peroxin-3 [Piptocephalis cylindrospora]|uniref:Peroxin-3 n=1 Tax=Piptocephalis cylindrospora TaxID=1907219 RepID=A0A4P9Y2N0_9FUNG|nr:Peroxin-3 [Piptocephalis cylindrospora]|eukprot:RKP13107.1 Peroxin-3 [Piptocephalis cylindrospora]
MLTTLGQSLWSYRRGLTTLATVGAGGVWLTRYMKDQLLHHSRKSAQERAIYTDIERRFEQNQQDVAWTVQALLSDMSELLDELSNADRWMIQLKQTVKTTTPSKDPSEEKGPSTGDGLSMEEQPTLVEKPMTKLELWTAVKTESYVRPIASIYLLILLTLLSHTQINLLGRSFYVASVGVPEDDREQSVQMALAGSQRLGWEEERIFLSSLPSHLLHHGARECVAWVREAVKEVMDPVSLRSPCGSTEIQGHVRSIRERIEAGDSFEDFFQRCTGWMIPNGENEASILEEAMGHPIPSLSSSLRGILDETYDLLESPNALQVTREALATAFDIFDQQLQGELAPSLPPKVVEIGDMDSAPTLPRLASLLPRISRTTYKIWDESKNRYIKDLDRLPALRAYSAIVYSSYATE